MARKKRIFTFQELKTKDYVTLLGTCCGIAAIVLAFDGRALRFACFLIYMGAVFDLLDGWVARRWNQKNEIGTQIDSLSDAVVFSVAPAIIMFSALLSHFQANNFHAIAYIFLVLAILYFIVCGVVRLAWFNISDFEGYTGLVVPGSAVYLIAYYQVWYIYSITENPSPIALNWLAILFLPFIFFVGTLNVSHFIVYDKTVKRKVGYVKKLLFLGLGIGIFVVTMGILFMELIVWYMLAFCIFFLCAITGWVIFGVVNYIKLPKNEKDTAAMDLKDGVDE